MDSLRSLVERGAVVLDAEADDDVGMIRLLAARLAEAGVVEDVYGDRCVERESGDPTGLPAAGGSIAIPHRDPAAVREAAIAIGRPRTPVRFAQMGDPEEHVDAEVVFLLALPAGRKQVVALREVALLAQDADRMRGLLDAPDQAAVLAALPGPGEDGEDGDGEG